MQTNWARVVQRLCGITLAAISIVLLVHGAKASLAHALYFQSKYAAHSEGVHGVLRRNEDAFRLYPFNAHSCAWAAQRAHLEALSRPRYEKQVWYELAEWWCDRGLRLNPHRRDLRRLKSRLLGYRDPAAAARDWADYVEWHFWDPANHIRLVELYAAAGEIDKAEEALAVLKSRPRDYAKAVRYIDKVRGPEM